MPGIEFIDGNGTFVLKDSNRISYLYFPVGGESGMMSSLTPEMGGDAKTSQNTFILEPVSSDNLHNNKSTRNFWLLVNGNQLVSATGASALQHSRRGTPEEDEVTVEGGLLYQRVTRKIFGTGLQSEITCFVPAVSDKIELTKTVIKNVSDKNVTFIPTAATPIYGRSATNIRDHRNVTSMLNRVLVTPYGVVNNPTLTFDERGHQKNKVTYGFFASEGAKAPEAFCPTIEEFIGEGGALDCPDFAKTFAPSYASGTRVDGYEVMGAARFEEKTLAPGESVSYFTALLIEENDSSAATEDEISEQAAKSEAAALKYINEESFEKAFADTKAYWLKKNNIRFHTGNQAFDSWMYWVGVQPMLRRIFGCSFLPHHDYGKGGRGWRDLWQDCLALIIMDPSDVRDMLVSNFGGVRTDGTNATIIGSRKGEFIADRNGITRVWMDHAMWPFGTVELYVKESGDLDFLFEKAPYFTDRQVMRGEKLLEVSPEGSCEGTVIEHLLVQNLAAFYDVGEHGHMRLRGADWNDALDMAEKYGESVAFTASYSSNYDGLADMLEKLASAKGVETVSVESAVSELMGNNNADDDTKRKVLFDYCDKVKEGFSGDKKEIPVADLVSDLREKAEAIRTHIRNTEWFTDSEGYSHFNSYYDNSKRAVEKEKDGRMMITGQVFTIMSGVAEDSQIPEICRAADRYLYDASIGGYKLNTDFKEIKTDMGRMFGFAYGQKENGAVFSHMTVMYGNSLYKRGFVKEGWKVLGTLSSHAMNSSMSKIYPGIPEYFDARGRGVYHFLTGAASWLMLTMLNEVFGVKGEYGDLKLEPKLLPEQFDDRKEAGASFMFNGCSCEVTYRLLSDAPENGMLSVKKIELNGSEIGENINVISKDSLPAGGSAKIVCYVEG